MPAPALCGARFAFFSSVNVIKQAIPNVGEAQMLSSKSILRQNRQMETNNLSQGNLKHEIHYFAVMLSQAGHPRDTRSTQGTPGPPRGLQAVICSSVNCVLEGLTEVKTLLFGSISGIICGDPQAG